MATVVNIHDAKSSLSRLVKRAASGEEILIARNGKPIARLTRLSNRKLVGLIGAFAGKLHIGGGFWRHPRGIRPIFVTRPILPDTSILIWTLNDDRALTRLRNTARARKSLRIGAIEAGAIPWAPRQLPDTP